MNHPTRPLWGTRYYHYGKNKKYMAVVHKQFLGYFRTRKEAHEKAIAYAKEHKILPFTRMGIPHLVGPAKANPALRMKLIQRVME